MAAACPPPVKPPRRQNQTVQKGTDLPEVRCGTATPAPGPARHHRPEHPGHRAAADPPL